MNRHAYLIGGMSLSKPLRGVEADVDAWKAFLQSPIGGGWLPTEISDLSTHKRCEVLSAIAGGHGCDYTLVCFAGHGYLDVDDLGFDVTCLELNDQEVVTERELNPKSDRCLMVLDCCRKPIEMPLVKIALDESDRTLDLMKCRHVYEAAVMSCEKGLTTIYAVEKDHSAADMRSFTRVMLKLAATVAPCEMTAVVRANELVRAVREIMPPQQSPVYEGGRRIGHYPMAVNPYLARRLIED